MKVIVMGAGVIGVTTAYYLAKAGAEVTVLDRQLGPGLETSYANAGELSYGMTSPWAAPGIPVKAVKWLFMKRRPLFIWPLISPTMWAWGAQMLRNCNEDSYRVNKSRMVRISNYSRDVMPDLISETGIEYDGREQGTLQLFRTEKQLKGSKADQEILAEYDSPFEVLDPEGCIAVEPALAGVRGKFVGGLRLTADRTGDCRMFTVALAEKCADMGVEFQYGQSIRGIAVENDRVAGVDTELAGRISGDKYVCALGSYGPRVLTPIGVRLPVYPVKGYSVTLPVTQDADAPQSTIMDETHKVAITRLGDRIRVAGTAEIAGYSNRLGPHATDTVRHVIGDLFPKGGDLSKAEGWTGLRPMTPDGTPVLGPSRYDNLYLNTGHGTLGWTMACGSGRIVADTVLGRTPEVSLDGLTAERYGR
ncbi:D-amino acid dehydrogenase [Mameliella sediminis]|uniref:D-amino acid dehydrogenase n=1 Tax=Mameliella sediminis TaxID=2836866 RepID=UPI001C46051F|nr:D-amino acid dehydrogenase [Mameliella sediminis]MBY6116754.1 D-amino acid dehydrogenase [Antarctobacter heliothermus]MBY6146507.1 D-amino acid dehydrogenase [Mameliella alba]MBV7396409.1 D-amino acid dehydrogenase [Mameliella sediminis]MBY6162736.1 D-amino acid dehydrogenase [Mameliella alba]MBY6170999.1 D-amino acid dehydrogenase [Mameliella alba]